MQEGKFTGYCWITPDGTCLNVAEPIMLTPMILDHCPGIRQMYNTTDQHDDLFHLNLMQFAYKRGYIRISKHKNMLGVEGYTSQHIQAHAHVINRLKHSITHKGATCEIHRFTTDQHPDLVHLTRLATRNRLFPRR